MQAVFLDVLQQYAAGAVHDAFRDTGGATGIQHVERMVEGHRNKIRFATGLVKVIPQADLGAGPVILDACVRVRVGHDDQLLAARAVAGGFH